MTFPYPKHSQGLPGAPCARSLPRFSAEALHTWACRSLHFEKSERRTRGQSPPPQPPWLGGLPSSLTHS